MAQITINIPDAIATQALRAYTDFFGYDTNKLNGETRPQFAKRMVANHIKGVVKSEAGRVAADAARVAEEAIVDGYGID